MIFIYPISHKADDTKNFFDTRDSGARERGVAWNYALTNHMKYFCFAVHDQVEKYKDYIFSLESDEARIAEVSGTVNGVRGNGGTQVVIPNNYIPSQPFDRILTRNNFYIAVIHRDGIRDYIEKCDNRPYMTANGPVALAENVITRMHLRRGWPLLYEQTVKGIPKIPVISILALFEQCLMNSLMN